MANEEVRGIICIGKTKDVKGNVSNIPNVILTENGGIVIERRSMNEVHKEASKGIRKVNLIYGKVSDMIINGVLIVTVKRFALKV